MNGTTVIDALRIVAGGLVMSTIPGGGDHGTDYANFSALTVNRSGSFALDMDPDDAFPLFTALGEKLWAPGWQPFILNGDGYQQGTVWATYAHASTTYWYVATYDTDQRHARYVRVRPEADAGTVDVRVEPNGSGGTTVNVTYQLTGLSTAGNSDLEKSFSESSYSDMMESWRRAIIARRDKIDGHLNS